MTKGVQTDAHPTLFRKFIANVFVVECCQSGYIIRHILGQRSGSVK
jgi:hypothetical protein